MRVYSGCTERRALLPTICCRQTTPLAGWAKSAEVFSTRVSERPPCNLTMNREPLQARPTVPRYGPPSFRSFPRPSLAPCSAVTAVRTAAGSDPQRTHYHSLVHAVVLGLLLFPQRHVNRRRCCSCTPLCLAAALLTSLLRGLRGAVERAAAVAWYVYLQRRDKVREFTPRGCCYPHSTTPWPP
jgi:hypothetical protein